jgi:hypothetical protein
LEKENSDLRVSIMQTNQSHQKKTHKPNKIIKKRHIKAQTKKKEPIKSKEIKRNYLLA